MPVAVFGQVKRALAGLNPRDVHLEAMRPVRIGLVAPSPEMLGRMETYFVPPHLSSTRRAESVQLLVRGSSRDVDIEIYDAGLLRPAHAFSFDPEAPEECIRRILRAHPDLALPLARNLHPFRRPAAHRIIRATAKTNALFSIATALPDVFPSLASIPWAIGEFTSDAAFLTANQVHMAFQLAAASDRKVGYREQRSEIASITAGAFGWRAIARELIGKIPFGGGLIPKAAVAWAATFVVGLSLERLYRLGYGYSRAERRTLYEESYETGRQIARMLLSGKRSPKPELVPLARRAG